VRPASIHLVFDSLESRLIPVKPNLDFQFLSRFDLAGEINVIPPVVEVTGPRAIIGKVDTIWTEYRIYRNIKTTLQKEIPLEIPQHLSAEPGRVGLIIPVDEFTENAFYVPIGVRSLPEGVKIRLFPREAEVSFSIGLKRYAELTPETFSIYVDWEDIAAGIQNLPLYTDSIPGRLKSLKISPQHVEYLIERN
jgi:YbbR domain-containing protein